MEAKLPQRIRIVTIGAALSLASCAVAPAQEELVTQQRQITNVSALVGLREYDEDDWEPVESQTSFGLEIDTRNTEAPIGFEGGFSYSSDDDDGFDLFFGDFSIDAEFTEVYGGVRKTWDSGGGNVNPYVAGGLSYVEADIEAEVGGLPGSEDDGSVGVYFHGGVTYSISRSFLVGVDVRALLGTDIEIAGVEGDADYFQIAFLVGFSF